MAFKRILFIGLGGAGQRHLRMFRDRLGVTCDYVAYRTTGKTPLLNANFTINKDSTVEETYNVTTFTDLDRAFETKPDLCVISTPSSLHYDVALQAAERGISVFVEKPFSHSLDGFKAFEAAILERDLGFQVSFQRRYHPQLQAIATHIKNGDMGRITNAVFNVASYIPYWHPYEDFRELYACRADLGGGVLLTEIHEIDLCLWYFGTPESVTCIGGTYSDVGLDVEDTVHMTLDYSSFSVQINLTFWQKHGRRDLFIAGEDGYFSWDQDGNVLRFDDHKGDASFTNAAPDLTNDSMFAAQTDNLIAHFGPAVSPANLDDSRTGLAIVAAAKRSMSEGRAISLKDIEG